MAPVIESYLRGGVLGLVVGDALGVPVEFQSRAYLQQHPVQGMSGWGTHHQPPGTWSDDSSLTLCLLDALCEGYDLNRIAQRCAAWYFEGVWTPHGEVFDIGIATRAALTRIREGVNPESAGGSDEYSNGNGSLMRILPLFFAIRHLNAAERFARIRQVSSITHAHIRSVLACFYYLELIRAVTEGADIRAAYPTTNQVLVEKMQELGLPDPERQQFRRVLAGDLDRLPVDEIRGSGYVIHSLEACLWCVLTSNSYREAVLKAVHLGEDTDTTAAITGGLAGIVFGFSSIPPEWLQEVVQLERIEQLLARVSIKLVKT